MSNAQDPDAPKLLRYCAECGFARPLDTFPATGWTACGCGCSWWNNEPPKPAKVLRKLIERSFLIAEKFLAADATIAASSGDLKELCEVVQSYQGLIHQIYKLSQTVE